MVALARPGEDGRVSRYIDRAGLWSRLTRSRHALEAFAARLGRTVPQLKRTGSHHSESEEPVRRHARQKLLDQGLE